MYITLSNLFRKFYIFVCYSPLLTLGLTLCIVHSMDFGKWKMPFVYHYSINQSSFNALSFIYSSRPSHSPPLTMIDLFYCLWSFEFFIVSHNWIICYVAFPDWFPLLSNMHLRFFCVSSWLVAHFFLSLN